MAAEKFLPELISATQLTKKNVPATRQSFGKRVAAYYELELISEGSGAIITDGQIIPAIPERLFIRRPGMRLEGFAPYYSYYIVFSDSSRELEQLNLPAYLDGMGQLSDSFKTIRNHFIYPDAASDFEIKSCIFKILAAVLKGGSNTASPAIEASVRYIKSHLEEELSVASLAKESGYSQNHYTNLFKAAMGETPSGFIRRCRIRKACELLEETNETVETIAQMCGFDNFSYFFRAFKKIQGRTPHAYRKAVRRYINNSCKHSVKRV